MKTIIRSILFIIFLQLVTMENGVCEEPDLLEPFGSFTIAVTDTPFVFPGAYYNASIMLDSLIAAKLSDFSLLIAYDTSQITFNDFIIGDAFFCWDIFEYDLIDPEDCGDSCSTKLIRITAANGRNSNDYCEAADGVFDSFPVEIAKIKFWIANKKEFNCNLLKLSFYWQNCMDNRINLAQSNVQFFGNRVFGCEKADSMRFRISTALLVPPDGNIDSDDHIYGANPACIPWNSIDGKPVAVYYLDFHNGGFAMACAEKIDARGDINLNHPAIEP